MLDRLMVFQFVDPLEGTETLVVGGGQKDAKEVFQFVDPLEGTETLVGFLLDNTVLRFPICRPA